jgi:hypothetical protein
MIDRALGAKMEVMETRLTGIDRATEVQAGQVRDLAARAELERGKAAADVERQLQSIRDYFLEKIERVKDVAAAEIAALRTMIAERDERVRQAYAESKTSLDAAMSAASASVAQQNLANATASNKQEVAFQKLLDTQAATSRIEVEALKNQATDLKDRVARLESQLASALSAINTRTEVKTETKVDSRAMQTAVVAIISVVLTIVIFLSTRLGGGS